MGKLKLFISISLLSGAIGGFFAGIVWIKDKAFLNIIKTINWTNFGFWLSIIIGLLIPLGVNYLLMKKQEVIKLKAKLAQDKLDIVRGYKAFDFLMRATIISSKKVADLSFLYETTPQDQSAPTIRFISIFQDQKTYNEWYSNYLMLINQLNGLESKRISNYIFYIQNYLANLEILIDKMPDEKMWEIGVAVKNDFFNISSEFSDILSRYLNHDVYRFKNEDIIKECSDEQNKVIEKLYKTNLYKYLPQLTALKNNI